MDSKYDVLIFDIFVNQPKLAKKVKKIIENRSKDGSKAKKK